MKYASKIVNLTTFIMNSKPNQNPQSNICPICNSYMLNHPTNIDFLKCPSCGYCLKIIKVKK